MFLPPLWSVEVEATSVTLTDLQSTSVSRRKIVLLSPQRDAPATAKLYLASRGQAVGYCEAPHLPTLQ